MLRGMRSLSLALGGLYLIIAMSLQSAPRQPNVLLICVDDLKPLLGCYGQSLVKSPNMDRLSSRGVLFQKAYCNQAVCAPSRNSLMTGMRPGTIGIYDLGTNFRLAVPRAVTMAEAFKNAGYTTEALGKIFHVGHGNQEDPASWTVAHWRPSTPMYVVQSNMPPSQPKKGKTKKKKAPADPRGRAVECADVADSAYADGQVADEAIRRLQTRKESGRPFFLAVGFLKPHLPFVAPKKYWDLYKREQFEPYPNQEAPVGAPEFAPTTWGELRNYSDIPDTGPLSAGQQRELIHGYYAAVSYTDAQIGRVLGELERLGLAQDTVVVLWGDHGWHLGDHGMWCKHTNYEEAARIPLIICVPGLETHGDRSSSLVESVDVYPTLCELAGIQPPPGLDGKSVVPVLRNPTKENKPAVMHFYPRNVKDKGQLIGRAVRTSRYRLVEWKAPGEKPESAVLELYDYEEDPGETRNLAKSRPEVVRELRAILARHPEAKPQVSRPAS